MVDPIGTTLGAVSLVIQLLDGAVKGYTFFLAVGDFPQECLHLRTGLEIQQRRILDFSEAADILNFQESEHIAGSLDKVPRVLRKDHLVLVSIFNQIQTKLGALATFTSRYEETKSSRDEEENDIAIAELDIKEQYPALVRWDRAAAVREHARGTNHLHTYYRIGKSIVKHPKRLRWTAFDRNQFQTVLNELAGYNDYLYELLDGEYSRRLDDRTQKTYMEMVLVRDQLDDLQRLFTNAMIMIHTNRNGYPGQDGQPDSVSMLKVLADTKRVSVANDATDEEKPPQYHELIHVEKLSFGQSGNVSMIELPANGDVVTTRTRSLGTFRAGNSQPEVQIFVEWKKYIPISEPSDTESLGAALRSNTDRVKGLVALLQTSKLESFCAPECLGFFDIRDGALPDVPRSPDLFGIVYKIPGNGLDKLLPVSLFSQLGSKAKPSLSDRMKLAHKISNSLLYFNSVQWYHKGLRSDAIVFHPDFDTKRVDVSKPFLAGFEYARPGSGSSTYIPAEPSQQVYVHPDYQSSSDPGYARSYDIYALGMVLIEIAYWSPINCILAGLFKDGQGKPSAQEARNVRQSLLSTESTYIPDLRGMVGDRYFRAVDGCIRGLVRDDENENTVEVSMKLHEAFIEAVVDNLGTLTDL